MIKTRLSFFFGFLLVSVVHGQSGAKAKSHTSVLTLNQAVQMSLATSPAFLIAKNQMDSAHLEMKNAFSKFFPSLDLSASHGVREINPTQLRPNNTSAVSGATLSLTENLYDNGESDKKNRIAQYRYQLAKLSYEKSRAEIVRAVLLAYYRLNITTQNLKLTKTNFDQLEKLANQLKNQFQQGIRTQKDYLGFKTRAQRARLNVLRAEQDLVQAKTALLQVIGLDPETSVQIDESVKPLRPPTPLTVDISPESLYEFRRMQVQSQIDDLEVQRVNRNFWPQLNLVAAASYGSSDYINTNQSWKDNETSQWSLLLNLNFNLLDWGVRSREIQIAALAQKSSEQTSRALLLKDKKELEEFKLEVANSNESFQLSKELQKMEEDSYRILERDYRSGRSTYLELITGLANLLDAQSRGLEADYNQADLYLKWKYYKGILSEETIVE